MFNVSLIDGHIDEPSKSYFSEIIEKIIIERNKKVDNAILGEIEKIAIDNKIVTKITLNEKAIVNALEKQIPKKVEVTKYDIGGNNYFCSCGNKLRNSSEYCDKCGCKLDWSDTE